MSSTGNHIEHLTPELVNKYLRGELSNEDMHAVERLMLESSFEEEAMEGFENLGADLEQDLARLNQKLEKRIHAEKRTFPAWFKIAASVSLLALSLVLVLNWNFDPSPKQTAGNEAETPAPADETLSAKKEANETVDLTQDSLIALHEEEQESLADSKSSSNLPAQPPPTGEILDTAMEEVSESDDMLAEVGQDEFSPPSNVSEIQSLENEAPVAAPATSEVIPETVEVRKKETTSKRTHGDEDKANANAVSKSIRIRGVSSFSSSKLITGQVTAEGEGEGIPGVNVTLKNTLQGTITDFEGNYSLDVPNIEENVLVFSYVGFRQEEVPVADQATLDVEMSPDVSQLSEVVVTGMGVEERRQALGYSTDEPRVITPAQPEIGRSAYKKYLQDNIRMPPDSLKARVIVKFDVLPDGSLANFDVEKSPGSTYSQEALRLVTEGPGWKPAYEDGVAVRDKVRVKVRFR